MIDQTLPLVTIIRDITGEDGTFGVATHVATGHSWQTAELEWLNNQPNISSIPPSEYLVQLQPHPKMGYIGAVIGKNGMAYEIMNVTNRSAILIHPGNWAGQETDGERSDLLGCITLGTTRGELVPPGYTKSQEAVEGSVAAVTAFYKEMGGNPFRLIITNNF